MRRLFVISSSLILALVVLFGMFYPPVLWALIVVAPPIALGCYDYLQTEHSILRHFPVLGHMRYFLEMIRPELYQYFVESDTRTVCPWKGTAGYYDVVVEGAVKKEAAWYYADPKDAALEIKDYVAFWRGITIED